MIVLIKSVHVSCGSLLFHHLPSTLYCALCMYVFPTVALRCEGNNSTHVYFNAMNKIIIIKININATVNKCNVYVQYWWLRVSGEFFWKRKLCVDFVWFDCCHFILWWVCSSIDLYWSNQAVWKPPFFSYVHHCWYSAPGGFPNLCDYFTQCYGLHSDQCGFCVRSGHSA